MSGANNSIKVVARFRPQNKVELESGGQPIVAFDAEDTCTLDVRAHTRAMHKPAMLPTSMPTDAPPPHNSPRKPRGRLPLIACLI